jgi:hypothetical protein
MRFTVFRGGGMNRGSAPTRPVVLPALRWLQRSRSGIALLVLSLTACGTGAVPPSVSLVAVPSASQPPPSHSPAPPPGASASAAPSIGAPSQPVAPPLTAPANATLAVTATEYSFNGPDTIQAGQALVTMTNNGTYAHHAQLWRLKDGISIAGYKAILAHRSHAETLGAIASLVGGVAAVAPGRSGQAIVNLTPGIYFFVCVMLGPVAHLYEGMFRGLTVTKPSASPTPWAPAADGTVTFSGGGFQLPAGIVAGHHVWTFENEGPGARSFEVRSAQGDGYYGGGAVVDQGGHETVVLDLGPGDYVAMSTWVETGMQTTTAFTVH